MALTGPVGGRSGHSYGHVYGGAYAEDDYSITQHQARTGNGAISRVPATAPGSATGSTSVVAPAERQQQQQQNGKPSGRYQDPAPRAWGDGGNAPRYVASPTHAPSSALSTPGVSWRGLLTIHIPLSYPWLMEKVAWKLREE